MIQLGNQNFERPEVGESVNGFLLSLSGMYLFQWRSRGPDLR